MKVKVTIDTPDIGERVYYFDVKDMKEAQEVAEDQMIELIEEYVDERGGNFDVVYDGGFDYEIEIVPDERK